MSDYDFLFEGGFLVFLLIIGVVGLVISIFYLLSLQKALDAVDPMCRKMPSGQVWLLLIPIFNWIWQFVVVSKIADSFKAEFERLNVPVQEERPTYNIGLTKNILSLCSIIPFLGTLASIGALICWIMYWIKVEEYRKLVVANQGNEVLDAERGIFHQ
jgi:hypothetical protein